MNICLIECCNFVFLYCVCRFKPPGTPVDKDGNDSMSNQSTGSNEATSQQQQHQQFLGDASGAIPVFGDIEVTGTLPEGLTRENLRSFEKLYKEHCEVCKSKTIPVCLKQNKKDFFAGQEMKF